MKLKAVRDCPIIIGSIPHGTVVAVRKVGFIREWFCIVRWPEPRDGRKRSMQALLHEADMVAFKVIPRKQPPPVYDQLDLPLSFPEYIETD